MKKLVSFGLVGLMLIASLAIIPQNVNAQGPGLVSSIFNNMERNRRSLRSLRAGLVMQKYDARIKSADMYQGEVNYVPGSGNSNKVRIDWRKPQNEVLAVRDGKYTLFKPRMNMAYVGATNSKNNKVSGVLGFGLNVSGAQLKNNFEAQFMGQGTLENGGPQVTWLKLIPKGAAGYKFAEIWVDGNGMPIQTRVTERNGDTTLVRLNNIQRNANISSDVFNLNLGSGVKIVKG